MMELMVASPLEGFHLDPVVIAHLHQERKVRAEKGEAGARGEVAKRIRSIERSIQRNTLALLHPVLPRNNH